MSKLLINEQPLLVSPSLACKFGLLSAVVLQQFHFFLEVSTNTFEGRKWVYNTYEDWAKMFPFAGESTIRKVIKDFEKLGVLNATDKFNKMKMDKTKWYSIDYEKLNELCEIDENTDCSNSSDHLLNFSRGAAKNEQLTSAKNEQTNNHRDHIDYNIDLTPLPPKGESADADDESAVDFEEVFVEVAFDENTTTRKAARPKNKNPSVDYQAVADLYNQANEDAGAPLPMVAALNDRRKRAIARFMKSIKHPTLDCAQKYFAVFFEDLKPHHLGQNDRGWRANFDFAIREDVVLRVREGAL